MKLSLLWAKVGPYHAARIRAASDLFAKRGWEVLAAQVAGREQIYPLWEEQASASMEVHTLFPGRAYETLSSRDRWQATMRLMKSSCPDCVAVPGYGTSEARAALQWARANGAAAVMMMASKADDKRRWRYKEWIKSRIIREFDSAIVGGTPQSSYAISLGMSPHHVFQGYNVVDNRLFEVESDRARADSVRLRHELGLPEQYFFCVGRFDPVKNIPRLLEAFRLYRKETAHPWSLVFCGWHFLDPKVRVQLAGLASESVHALGFQPIGTLPTYYGLASCFVMASVKDTWNLAVNEAMASGLPVLVSRACGCAQDLVQEGVNGYTFAPYDVESLAKLMLKVSSDSVGVKEMGRASRRIITGWSPRTFGENLWKAVEVAVESAQRRPRRHFPNPFLWL
jgi:1,2-diacylglycerol 3-alpha-glucosyltransferase